MDTHESEQEGFMVVRLLHKDGTATFGWMEIADTLSRVMEWFLVHGRRTEILEVHVGPWEMARPAYAVSRWQRQLKEGALYDRDNHRAT